MGNGGQAMIFAIYYRASDGEILGWTTQHNPVAPDGMILAVFDEPFQPEPLNERFDAAANAVIEKTAEEKRRSQLPTLHNVQVQIYLELVRTDIFMLPDFPIAPERRHAWASYRQMLRGLSKLARPAAMITGWTLAPDGVDPIADLRERQNV
jgi:hypothetical protein